MKPTIAAALFLLALLAVSGPGCEKDYRNTTPAPVPTAASASWTESFTDHAGLGARGWVIINNTDKPGQEAWRKGRFESTNKLTTGIDYTVGFPAYSAERSPYDFMSVDMYAGAQVANMSVWLITPPTKIKNGDVLTFYTRSRIDNGSSIQLFGKEGNDRMQVRANYRNNSINVGRDWNSVGDFTALMVDINSSLSVNGYPQDWTKYTLTVSGVTGTIEGRFAFRYFVPQGGPDGNNAGLIGIDEVSFSSK